MRLVARGWYNGKIKDTEIREIPGNEMDKLDQRVKLVGIPVYWSKDNSSGLRFWPIRSPASCEIVDLDHSND